MGFFLTEATSQQHGRGGSGYVAEEADKDGDREVEEEIPTKFNFRQFLTLAEHVIDHGDLDSFIILDRLHAKWKGQVRWQRDRVIMPAFVPPVQVQEPAILHNPNPETRIRVSLLPCMDH
ncbi:hypothetical protein Salat_1115600 [Sesamum alatum]|uniref:Uncharacterized protein n=1 Tax=Sesamum alatum TaxID=300844 RepID=A0AAE2CT45_9LAMI|nr:hypothetical protein Salat_1115600 [Sesamum alatum]